jgi:hypothetical protein
VGFVVVPHVAVGETARSEVMIMAAKKTKKATSRLAASKKPSTTAKRKFAPKKSTTRAKSAPKRTATKKSPKKTKRPSSPKRVPEKKKVAPKKKTAARRPPAPTTSSATPRSPKTFADHVRDFDAGTGVWFTVAGGIEHAVIQKQGSDGTATILTDAGVTEVVSVGNLFETADGARAARTR